MRSLMLAVLCLLTLTLQSATAQRGREVPALPTAEDKELVDLATKQDITPEVLMRQQVMARLQEERERLIRQRLMLIETKLRAAPDATWEQVEQLLGIN